MRGRPTTCRAGCGRAWPSGGASKDESRRRQLEELEPDGQKAYHSVSARLAYLPSDRPRHRVRLRRLQCAVGTATRADLTCLTVDGHSDADAAGCPKTRRISIWGLRTGRHTLSTWSSTQKVVSRHGTRTGTRGSRANLDRRCGNTRAGFPQCHQTQGNKVLLAAAEKKQTKSSRSRRSAARLTLLT